MKMLRYLLFLFLSSLATVQAEAKLVQASHLYMFGFSASFKDSVIYITDIQDLQNVWIDRKTKHLYARDSYSLQLKEYFTEKLQEGDRVCMVFFATSRSKAEQKYRKLKKKYTEKSKGYDVRELPSSEFSFQVIEASSE